MVPRRFIHETLNVQVIERLLRQRAAAIEELQLRFGPDYKDKLYYFVILDDMVRTMLEHLSLSVACCRSCDSCMAFRYKLS